MKKFILTAIVYVLFFNAVFCQTTEQRIKIDNIQYTNENGFLSINFNIVNLSKDTLFLNYKMLNIRATKNKKNVKLDYPNVHEQPFIKPVFKNGEQVQIKTGGLDKVDSKEKSANYFANKLFLKNLKINHKLLKYRDRIIQNIVHNCIVLLPSETYEYDTYLFSRKFDKTCKVSVKYLYYKRFTYFVDDNGKTIDVMN